MTHVDPLTIRESTIAMLGFVVGAVYYPIARLFVRGVRARVARGQERRRRRMMRGAGMPRGRR